MVSSEKPAANRFVRYARKIYHPIGFTKGYNFILFFIFGGAFLGFCLSRTPYMNIPGRFCRQLTAKPSPNDITPGASPGDCYYYNKFTVEKIGIRFHLYCVIPAGILAVFQFVPVIRHKLILFHRLNGYVTILLGLIGSIGGVMIARSAFGGTIDTQTGTGALFILTTVSLFMAYINIKRLQIDQHRAWMLRAWAYFAVIVTVRLALRPLSIILTHQGNYWTVQPCDKVQYSLFNNPALVLALYPSCASFLNGTDPNAVTLAKVNVNAYDPVQIASGLGIGFGTCIWLGIFLHAIGVELYLHLTPREAQRLRNVSYQRQLEAGYKNPGNGGLTVQRFGDANPFVPDVVVAKPHGQAAVDSSSTLDATPVATEFKIPQIARPEAKTVDSGSSSE